MVVGCGKHESDVFCDFYYSYTGEKEIFKIRKDKVIIKTASAESAKELCKYKFFISAHEHGLWVLATIDPKKVKLENLLKLPEVVDVTYGLEHVDDYRGNIYYPKNMIYLVPNEGLSPEKIIEAAGITKSVESIELYNLFSNGYDLTLNSRLCDILSICRNLFESGLCKTAEPSCIMEVKHPN